VNRSGKRIDDRQAASDESVLHILGQQQSAAGIRSGGHDKRVPELKLVIDDQIGGRKHGRRFGSRGSERIGERE